MAAGGGLLLASHDGRERYAKHARLLLLEVLQLDLGEDRAAIVLGEELLSLALDELFFELSIVLFKLIRHHHNDGNNNNNDVEDE